MATNDGATPDALVGQVAAVQGRAWLYDREQQAWLSPGADSAWANWPLTQGDRLRTEPGARLTLRIASATLRLDGDSTVQLKRLAPDLVWVQLLSGQAAWHVPGDARARTLLLQAGTLCARPLRAGHYSLQLPANSDSRSADGGWSTLADRAGGAAGQPWLVATTWRGELGLQAPETDLRLPAGRQAQWLRPPPAGRAQLVASQSSAFAEWALAEARQDLPPPDSAELPETLSGAQTLAAHGQWRDDPEWGRLWVPTRTEPGWSPYRDGRWTWRPSWGWTWVDAAPWGFVTVYYGRWVPWRGGWAWVPGHHGGGLHHPPPVRPVHPVVPGHPILRPPPVFHPVPPGLTPPPHRPRPLPTPVQPGRPWVHAPGHAPGLPPHDGGRPERGDRPAPALPSPGLSAPSTPSPSLPSAPWPGRGERPERGDWGDRGGRGGRGDEPDKPTPRVPGWGGHTPASGAGQPLPASPPAPGWRERPETGAEPRPAPRAEQRPELRPEPRPELRPEARPEPMRDVRAETRPEPRPESRPSPFEERGTPWGRWRPGMDGGRPGMEGGRPAWSQGNGSPPAPAQPMAPALPSPRAAPTPTPMAAPMTPPPAALPPPVPQPMPRMERPSPPPAAPVRLPEPARADELRERERERHRPGGPSAQQAR